MKFDLIKPNNKLQLTNSEIKTEYLELFEMTPQL